MRLTQRKLNHSQRYLREALRVIPGASQTFSKAPSQYVQGVAPIFLQRGKGSHVWDVDGNEYIDYPTALGPIVLGHGDPEVTEAVTRQLRDGTIFSLPHPLEIEVAQLLIDVIPCAEMVRFGKNGSDVTSAAIRVARAYTGRSMIASCGYHGWQDWTIGTTTRNLGIPEEVSNLTRTFVYNDISSLEMLFEMHPGRIAAVILEPVGIEAPENDFLQEVAVLARSNGALLIFDEVITGFRVALGGAQEYYGISPDLACYAKAMANGYPVSALVGRRDVMELFEEVFFSSTFGGETLSLAAAQATVKKIRSHNVIDHLWRQGKKLQDGYNALAAEFGINHRTECVGLAPRTVVRFTDSEGDESLIMRSLLQQELIKRGILFLVGFNTCYSLSDEDVEYTLDACREALGVVTAALDTGRVEAMLEGPPVEPVFRSA